MFPVSACALFPRAWQLCFTSYLKMLGTIKLNPWGEICLGFWHLTTGATSLLAGGLTQLANMHLALTEAADGQRKLMLQIGLNRVGRKLLPRLQVELLIISLLDPFPTSLKMILQLKTKNVWWRRGLHISLTPLCPQTDVHWPYWMQ